MMRWIVGSSLRFRYLVIALGVGMMYFGVLRLRDLPVDVFPEFAPARVEIQTICLGLSPAEVEALVTVPLENALNGVPGVDVLRSKSVPQLSSVTAHLQARRRRDDGAPAGDGAGRDRHGHLPTWAAPPLHDAAPVVDQPGHEDRHHLRRTGPSWTCRCWPTGRSGPACSACPASPTSPSGASS